MYKSERSIIAVIQLIVSLCFIVFITPILFKTGFKDFAYIPKNEQYLVRISYIILLCLFALNIKVHLSWAKQIFTLKTTNHYFNLIVLVSLPFILYFISNYISAGIDLWGDELYQMEDSAKRPLFGSRAQHQMPISYFFSYISNAIWGQTDISIRFATMSLNALALTSFYFLIKIFTRSNWQGFLFIILILGNYHILNYSFEARPQSTALFFLSIFLYSHSLFINARKITLNLCLYLFCTSLLLLLSIGFQPPFVILFFSMASALVYFKQLHIKKIIYYCGSVGIAGLVFLYFQFSVIADSPKRLINMNFENLLFNDYINFKFFSFNPLDIFNYNSIISANTLFMALLITSLLLVFVFKHFDFKSTNLRRSLSYLLTLFFFCPLVYNFYIHHIEWNFGYKYFYLIIPLAYLAIVLIFNDVLRLGNLYFNKYAVLMFTCISLLGLSFLMRFTNSGEIKSRWRHFENQKAYAYMKNELSPSAPIYCLGLNKQIEDCHGLGHYNRYMNEHTPEQLLNIYQFQVKPNYKPIKPSEDRFALLLEGSNSKLKKVIDNIDFDKSLIVSRKTIVWGEIIIFKSNLEIKKDIKRSLKKVESEIKSEFAEHIHLFSNYINLLN